MDAIAQIPLLGPLLTTVIPFLIVLGIVVFVHEYGHYIVGRWCGIHAEVFSIGFGKELFAWVDRRGTRWRVAALPLGGYVRFLGDSDPASARPDNPALAAMSDEDRRRAFPAAPLWKRAATVAAGPVFNFLLSIVIFAGMALTLGVGDERPVIGQTFEVPGHPTALRPGDEVLAVDGRPATDFSELLELASEGERHRLLVRRDGATIELETGPLLPPAVGGVASGGPADKAGIAPGDVIRAVNGVPARSFADLQKAVREATPPLTLTIEREGRVFDVALEPQLTPTPTADGIEMRPLIGVTAAPLVAPMTRTPGPLEALAFGATRTWSVIDGSLRYVAAIIGGEADSSSLGGPIRIASMSGEAAEAGLASFLGMIGMISASIGLINLFPIPALDGGHLLFYAIEAVRGRPLSDRLAEAATGIGIALVILLMIFVTYNDLAGM
ncbi:RIP metalloprotease RseP [Oceanicella actignis]|uniref:RIP metalloprotease RseP n=1 Tax=Oceanicella actignis TaxID=1189325 RepID=UPI0011E6E62D|nr:RIP metalloprotease RseP [Oceanicella actignis]TYO85001.1 regulator of sigma E protease [Oceanicella actignis]